MVTSPGSMKVTSAKMDEAVPHRGVVSFHYCLNYEHQLSRYRLPGGAWYPLEYLHSWSGREVGICQDLGGRQGWSVRS